MIGAATLGVLAATCVLLVRWPDTDVGPAVVAALVLLPTVVLGVVIAWIRPRARIAPLLCLVGAVPLLVVGLGDSYIEVLSRHPGALPAPPFVVGVWQGAWMLLYLPAAALMLTFPDGRLIGARWRWVLAGLFVVPALFALLDVVSPDPYPAPFQDVPRVWGTMPRTAVLVGVAALLPSLMGLLVASAAAMIVRYRRATDPVARAQLRWFALGAMMLPVTLLLCWVSYLLLAGPALVVIGLVATPLAITVATGIALLRHDLYDVDRAFSAAVTYALVTAALLGVFAVAEVASGVVLGRDSATVAALATALSALLLAPLKARLRRRVDRHLYPRRQAVLSTLAELQQRIDTGGACPSELEQALRSALHDPGLRVAFVLPGRDGLVDPSGAPLPEAPPDAVPVVLAGIQVGALLPGAGDASRELLREAAAASSVLVELLRSRLQLGRALQQVADSRARLLRAGYRERRRLERDLHDGAQQRLVSLGMSLRLAQRRLGTNTVDVDGLLDQAVAELGTAVAELRAIAHGLRPSCLDSGLAPALHALVSSVPIPVRLQLSPDPVPDEVATTAYYVASEALANAVKHADAAVIDLHVSRQDGHLRVRISDDGRGGAQPRPGSGLAGLLDRVAAAGGSLQVDDHIPCGTLVEAVLPCAR